MGPDQEIKPGGGPQIEADGSAAGTAPAADPTLSPLALPGAQFSSLLGRASRLDRAIPRAGLIPLKSYDEILELFAEVRYGQTFFDDGKCDIKAAHDFFSALGIGVTSTGFSARTTELLRVVTKEADAQTLTDAVLRVLYYDVALKSDHPAGDIVLNPKYIPEQQLRIFAAASEDPAHAAAVRHAFIRGLFTLYYEDVGDPARCLTIVPQILFFAGMRRTDHLFSFEAVAGAESRTLAGSVPVWRERAVREIEEVFDSVRSRHRDKKTDRFLEAILRSSRDLESLAGVVEHLGQERMRTVGLREWLAWAKLILPIRNSWNSDEGALSTAGSKLTTVEQIKEFRELATNLRGVISHISQARLLKKTEIAKRYSNIATNALHLLREDGRKCETRGERERLARRVGAMAEVGMRWGMDLSGWNERVRLRRKNNHVRNQESPVKRREWTLREIRQIDRIKQLYADRYGEGILLFRAYVPGMYRAPQPPQPEEATRYAERDRDGSQAFFDYTFRDNRKASRGRISRFRETVAHEFAHALGIGRSMLDLVDWDRENAIVEELERILQGGISQEEIPQVAAALGSAHSIKELSSAVERVGEYNLQDCRDNAVINFMGMAIKGPDLRRSGEQHKYVSKNCPNRQLNERLRALRDTYRTRISTCQSGRDYVNSEFVQSHLDASRDSLAFLDGRMRDLTRLESQAESYRERAAVRASKRDLHDTMVGLHRLETNYWVHFRAESGDAGWNAEAVRACRRFVVSLKLTERDWLYTRSRIHFVADRGVSERQPVLEDKDGIPEIRINPDSPRGLAALRDPAMLASVRKGIKLGTNSAIDPLVETLTEATDPLFDQRGFDKISGWMLVSPSKWAPYETQHTDSKGLFVLGGKIRRQDWPYDDVLEGKTVMFSYSARARQLRLYVVPRDRDGDFGPDSYARSNPGDDMATHFEFFLPDFPKTVRDLVRMAPRKWCFYEATTRLYWGDERLYREVDRRLEQAWPSVED